MTFSVALSRAGHVSARKHLVRPDHQEDLCFALWRPSRGQERETALVQILVLPRNGEREIHGNASFLPAYFERALGEAIDAGAGLAFMHSHPSVGWQDMSNDDENAERAIAAATLGATGLPLVGLTLGIDGAWSARFWIKKGPRTFQRQWCTSVRVVGDQLAVTYNDRLLPPPRWRPELTRTASAWGPDIQSQLARLHVGVVGVGSVGSIVAEALARMGIGRVRLLDFDSVQRHNLDRLLHAVDKDALNRTAKVEVVARALRKHATADLFSVEPFELSVVEVEGFRAVLDCDVLFSCVDRPWPRNLLNFVAYAHLIPVVDGGIHVEAIRHRPGLKRADWRTHVVGPDHKCLECLRQYDAGMVAADREGYFDDPSYIEGLPDSHPIKQNENVFTFSLATAAQEVLQMLALTVLPSGLSNPGAQNFHFVTANLDVDPSLCRPNCFYHSLIGVGDHATVSFTGRHKVAEEQRQTRARSDKLLLRRFGRWIRTCLTRGSQ